MATRTIIATFLSVLLLMMVILPCQVMASENTLINAMEMNGDTSKITSSSPQIFTLNANISNSTNGSVLQTENPVASSSNQTVTPAAGQILAMSQNISHNSSVSPSTGVGTTQVTAAPVPTISAVSPVPTQTTVTTQATVVPAANTTHTVNLSITAVAGTGSGSNASLISSTSSKITPAPTVTTIQASNTTNTSGPIGYVPGQVIVRYKTPGNMSAESISTMSAEVNSGIGAETITAFSAEGLKGTQLVSVPQNVSVNNAVDYYSNRSGVAYAEPNYIWTIAQVPNDPDFSKQWALQNTGQVYEVGNPAGTSGADCKATSAWDRSTGSQDVLVAVLDSGVDYTHPDLAANIYTDPSSGTHGYNVITNTPDGMDDLGHGTHCAGVIGAVGNNGLGISGINWNVKILPVKWLDSNGQGTTSTELSAITYANTHGAQIISCSFGGTQYSQALYDAISSSSALFVCAAGNSGSNSDQTPYYPAGFGLSNIVSVAASDANDKLCSFSNYGASSVSLAAPGADIYSTYLNGGYKYDSGTSMATPLVAGAAALLKSAKPGASASELKSALVSGVDKIPALSDKVASGGRLNVANSLNIISPGPTPTTATPTTAPTTIPTTSPTSTPTEIPTVTPTTTVSPGEGFISLHTGWNLVSVPQNLVSGADTSAIFSNVHSGGHSLLTYSPDSGWVTLKKDDKITPLMGIWIYSEQDDQVKLQLAGSGSSSRQLSAGWNLIGYAGITPTPAKDALKSVTDQWTYLLGYNAGIQQYETMIIKGGPSEYSDDRNMQPYQGYWIFMTASGTLTAQ